MGNKIKKLKKTRIRGLRGTKQRKRNLKYVFIGISTVMCASLVVNPSIFPPLIRVIRFSPIIGIHETIKFSKTLKYSKKGKQFLTILLLSLQLTGPLSTLSGYLTTTETSPTYQYQTTKLAFDYNNNETNGIGYLLYQRLLAARERLALLSKTRAVREHLPLTVLGVAHTYRGYQHYLAEDKMIGVLEMAFGGCLVTRPCFPKKMQGNKNLLIATGIALLVVDINISYNLEKQNFYEALEQQQKELSINVSINENKLRYLNMVLKDQEAQSAEDNQHFVFMLAQQKSLLVENHKKEINMKTTECNKKINNHLKDVEALDKMLKTSQTKAKMQEEILEKCQKGLEDCQKDHERL